MLVDRSATILHWTMKAYCWKLARQVNISEASHHTPLRIFTAVPMLNINDKSTDVLNEILSLRFTHSSEVMSNCGPMYK